MDAEKTAQFLMLIEQLVQVMLQEALEKEVFAAPTPALTLFDNRQKALQQLQVFIEQEL
jgi:hypothetical protein